MIKPTIGRVVWFWLDEFQATDTGQQPNAAMVVRVWNDTCVNLVVFDANGNWHPRGSVTLWQGEGPRPFGPHCEWMPFQKGQAAKAEELEKKIQGGAC
jgi:hypothetical protein